VKPISGKRMCKILERRGWVYDHTSGSHRIYKRDGDASTIAVPVHGNRDMRHGTQKDVMRRAGLTDADL
jgi:predicted RNA binding protein YcfA (HicA-like mRNA interferase family)